MTTKIEIRKRSIWAKHEKAYGRTLPKIFRDATENIYITSFKDIDVELDDLDQGIPDQIKIFESLKASRFVINLRGGNGSLSQSATDSRDKPTRGRYERCFKRRLRIVELVAGSVLTIVNLALQIFTPHRRIKWGPVCDKWNKANPDDIMTPAILKAEYYRAIKDKDMQREYFGSVAGWIEPVRDSIKTLIGDDDIQELIMREPMPEDEAYEILSNAIRQWQVKRILHREIEANKGGKP